MKKNLCAILAAALLVLTLSGCAVAKLDKAYDEAVVSETANEVAMHIMDGDYAWVEAMFDDTMASLMPAGKLEESLAPLLAELGDFTQISKTVVMGQNSNGVTYALAGVVCDCEDGQAKFTITFNTDMSVAGLYLQ